MTKQVVGSRDKYRYVTHLDSPNYNGPAAIRAIVVHHWGVKGQKYDSVVATCMYGEVSAHYVLMDGLVTCLVPPGLRAWHVANNDYQVIMPGVYDINANTIGIECRPECTAGDVETLAQLIAELWCDYGKVPVYGHKDFMNTVCPGDYYDKLDGIVARAEAIYDSIVNGEDDTDVTEDEEDELMAQLTKEDIEWIKARRTAEKETEPSDWAKKEVKAAGDLGITDMTRPQAFATREELMCMLYRALQILTKDTPKKVKKTNAPKGYNKKVK